MNGKKLVRRVSTLLTVLMLVAVSVTMTGAQAAAPVDKHVTTPKAFFGYDIGQDYKLTPWETRVLTGEGQRKGILDYAYELQRTSNRVRVFQYGKTEMGRPMILTVVTSPKNWARMDKLKDILNKLADPRQVASDDEARFLASQGKAVYWLSAGIHSTERTSPEVLLRLGYHLASGNDAWTLDVIDNAIVVLEGSINPDGVDQSTDWYYQYLNTPYTISVPFYGKYIVHDDNRDFVSLALKESQYNVQARFEWNPTVYHDLHQAKDMLYMSPGTDPTNEAVSPVTLSEWLGFFGYNNAQLIAKGWTGVFTWDYADMWYPGYNHGYSFMHNTNGRFYELQGANLASPRVQTAGAHSLQTFQLTGQQNTWYDPAPYTAPFTWTLMDAVNLEEDAIHNDLMYTVLNKDTLLYNFYVKGKTNMQKAASQAPYAFVIPANGGDNAGVTDMINNLHVGQHIEVDRAGTAFTVSGQQFAAGDYIVRMDQPYGLTAKNLLTVQNYPPIKIPYDVTAWTLGLMRNVQVVPLTETLPAGLKLLPVKGTVPYAGTLTGGPSNVYVIENGANNNLAVALPRLWKDPSFSVSQVDAPFTADGRSFPAGTLLVSTTAKGKDAVQDTLTGKDGGKDTAHARLKALVQDLGLTAYSVSDAPAGVSLAQPKVGLYAQWNITGTTPGEGFTRIRLDRAGWDYTRLVPSDVMTGSVADYNVIIIPSMSQSTLITGSTSSSTPPEYRGGIGLAGLDKLKSFVENGGTLVLEGSASTLPIVRSWPISVTVAPSSMAAMAVMASVAEPENPEDIPDFGGPVPPSAQAGALAPAAAAAVSLNCPGNIVRLQVNPNTKVGYGYGPELPLWCETASPFFDVGSDSQAEVVASYPNDGKTLLLSGYIAGESVLWGKAAIVDAPLGAGHIVLLGPNVLYRAQSTGDFMFFWNSLFEGSRK